MTIYLLSYTRVKFQTIFQERGEYRHTPLTQSFYYLHQNVRNFCTIGSYNLKKAPLERK